MNDNQARCITLMADIENAISKYTDDKEIEAAWALVAMCLCNANAGTISPEFIQMGLDTQKVASESCIKALISRREKNPASDSWGGLSTDNKTN